MFITHGSDCRKGKRITNYLLRVKNKDEGEERQKGEESAHVLSIRRWA